MEPNFSNLPDEPVNEAQPTAKKPTRLTKTGAVIAVVLVVIVAGCMAMSTMFSYKKQALGLQQSQPGLPLPAAIPPGDVSATQESLNTAAQRERQNQQQQALDAQKTACEVGAGVWRQVSQTNGECLTSQSDMVAGPMSKEQQAAVSRESDPRQQAKLAKEEARKQSLQSSTLAVDFSTEEAKQESAKQPVATEAKREVAEQKPASDDEEDTDDTTPAKKDKYAFDKYAGQLYRVFEGTVFETILTNRLEGEYTGPVNVMVTTDYWSQNRQKLLVPRGTRFLGVSKKVSSNNQQRLAITFRRMIMPDGYSVDLEKFQGLDQQGAAGIAGKVNHHYAKLFGISAALGAISGLAQIGNSTTSFGYSPTVSVRNGVSQRMGEEAQEVFSQALNRMPSITVKEGSRVRIWITQDIELPSYDNHQVPSDL